MYFSIMAQEITLVFDCLNAATFFQAFAKSICTSDISRTRKNNEGAPSIYGTYTIKKKICKSSQQSCPLPTSKIKGKNVFSCRKA